MLHYCILFALIVASLATPLPSTAKCPTPATISPCLCLVEKSLTQIHCGGDTYIDLAKIFTDLTHELKGTDTLYDIFYLNNTMIQKLPPKVFSDIQFRTVTIGNARSLSLISVDVFKGTETKVQELRVVNTPVIIVEPDYCFYDAINDLKSLESITLMNTSLSAIHTQAFDAHQKLISISITDGAIETIERQAFKILRSLRRLDLSRNRIDSIQESAIVLDEGSALDDLLVLDLSDNPMADNKTLIDGNAFLGLKRATNIVLNASDKYPDYYLNETAFEGFLRQSTQNLVTLTALDCTDCRNYWLLKDGFEGQVSNITCKSGTHLFDEKNFEKCH